MKKSPLERLPDVFMENAQQARALGVSQIADVWAEAARVAEQAIMETEAQLLSATDAAELSGYTSQGIRRHVQSGKLTNYGKPGSVMVARGELPRKPGRRNGRKLRVER